MAVVNEDKYRVKECAQKCQFYDLAPEGEGCQLYCTLFRDLSIQRGHWRPEGGVGKAHGQDHPA